MLGDPFISGVRSRSSDAWIAPVSIALIEEEEDHVLLWQVVGGADVVVGRDPRRLVAGHALWIPVGTPHRFTVHADSVMVPLFFASSGIVTTLSDPTLVVVDRDLGALMLAYSVSSHTIIQHLDHLGRQILSAVEDTRIHAVDLPMPTGGPALRIAELLRIDPGDTRGIEELAATVHTSARTIERRFRAETGMTLRTWRIRNRIESAAVLLRSGSTVAGVAHRVGYTSPNAFRRVFSELMGISPTAYVRRHASE